MASSFKMFIAFAILMFAGEPSDQYPFYEDEVGKDKIKKKIFNDKNLLTAYNLAVANKDSWLESKFESGMNSLVGLKSNFELGNLYAIRDFRVSKSAETNIPVTGGTAEVEFRPIATSERLKMSKKYKDIHLDGFEINCQSRMPAGSHGYAIASLYDERFVTPELGFLSTVIFPLKDKVTKATIKVNYSVSTLDEMNWVIIITVHEHGLKDNTRPCNFNIKTYYKYTNNLDRFSKCNDCDKGLFKVPEKSNMPKLLVDSVKNSLNYSLSLLTNKAFLNNLTKKELEIIKRCASLRETGANENLPIVHGRRSICISELDFETSKRHVNEDQQSDGEPSEFKMSP